MFLSPFKWLTWFTFTFDRTWDGSKALQTSYVSSHLSVIHLICNSNESSQRFLILPLLLLCYVDRHRCLVPMMYHQLLLRCPTIVSPPRRWIYLKYFLTWWTNDEQYPCCSELGCILTRWTLTTAVQSSTSTALPPTSQGWAKSHTTLH